MIIILSAFEAWKSDLEETCTCSYSKHSGAATQKDGSTTSYYHCNRSGAPNIKKDLAASSKIAIVLIFSKFSQNAPKMNNLKSVKTNYQISLKVFI